MKEIESAETYKIGWYDEEETILVMEVNGRWAWADAVNAILRMNEIVQQHSGTVYTVFHFTGPFFIPQPGSIGSLRQLLALDNPNEPLIVLVNASMFITKLISVVSRAYGMERSLGKYHFTKTFPEALALIEQDKADRITVSS